MLAIANSYTKAVLWASKAHANHMRYEFMSTMYWQSMHVLGPTDC